MDSKRSYRPLLEKSKGKILRKNTELITHNLLSSYRSVTNYLNHINSDMKIHNAEGKHLIVNTPWPIFFLIPV